MADKHKIKNKDINKSVRLIGRISRLLIPYYTEKTFEMANKKTSLIKGHWIGRKTSVETRYIDREDGTKLRILICRSKKKTTGCPVTGILWIHGGGYGCGLPEQDFLFASLLVSDSSSIMVLPDYLLSVEKPYPAALEDCYLTLAWMVENAKELNIDRNQIFVGGESAGGGLTAALCLYARDKNEYNIAFQMPLYPMLDDRQCTKSSQDNDAPVWNSKSNEVAWKLYLKGLDKENIPIYASPSRAQDLSNLPDAVTYIGTLDPFYDETILYFSRLKESGATVQIKEFPGCFHAFDLLGFKTKLGCQARGFLREAFKEKQKTLNNLSESESRK